MLKVALTGGIGSGKSAVAEMLEECGAIVLDSDQLARDVIERGTPGFEAVLAAFGDAILTDGEIDRAKLASIVFQDEAKRKELESIIHPLVRDAAESVMRKAPLDSVVINQIPLLVETNGAKRFDYVITVSASEQTRRSRLLERGLKDYEITKRMQAQVDDAAREAISHTVLKNEGSIEELQRTVEELWRSTLKPMAQGL
ncbi:MAG: dephospho-CoA kinase [Actinobacteria bacterium]|jgi:dephospho-CoA kinase|nr:dephospho-CoA kinase [Actinomycetota bacterium]